MGTPIRDQYLAIKRQHPDAILFFRLGDFYETFDEDAETIATALDIVLTSRKVAADRRVPMAGVPHHSADNYVARLIRQGFKVAICEQVGDTPINGLVPREVTRVVTPGTIVESSMLSEKENNYLLALVVDLAQQHAGLAYVDITTGEFAATHLQGQDIQRLIHNEVTRLHPAEIIAPDEETLALVHTLEIPGSLYEPWRFDLSYAGQILQDHFQVATLDGMGLSGKSMAVRAAGAILQYVRETQEAALGQMTRLTTYSTDSFMTLDAATRRNLELTETIRAGTVAGSLLGVLDKTVTAMGGRLLRTWLHQPLLDVEKLNKRLDDVELFSSHALARSDIRSQLRDIADVERLTNRVRQGIVLPRELLALRQSLAQVPQVQHTLSEMNAPKHIVLDPCPQVVQLIEQALADEPPANLSKVGVIRQGFSPELDTIIASSSDAKHWIANLENSERQRTGIKSLKVSFNKVFGYYIEVTKANSDQVPDDYIRKQTLVNAERYITPEMKEYENLILNADERQLEVEQRIFKEVCHQIAASAERLLRTSRVLGYVDTIATLAEVSLHNNYTRPTLSEDDALHITGGRHPVVEQMPLVGADGLTTSFVPNDVQLSNDALVHIITGPNMSGKSTYLRQVAQIVLLAQIGCFVPASQAHIGVVDRIFTRIGAQDEIHAGQSTFMVEMVETAAILSQSTPRSLIILDEVGRGTSTYDGLAIARAIVEYIHNNPRVRAKTLFATHYHELTELTKYLPHVRNYNVAVAEEGNKVIFLHKIIPGGADRSYGIHVAQIAGIPKAVIDRANQVLEELEGNADFREQKERTRRAFGGESVQQVSFLAPETHPLVDELKALDVDSLSPLEALNKLYELKKWAIQGVGSKE